MLCFIHFIYRPAVYWWKIAFVLVFIYWVDLHRDVLHWYTLKWICQCQPTGNLFTVHLCLCYQGNRVSVPPLIYQGYQWLREKKHQSIKTVSTDHINIFVFFYPSAWLMTQLFFQFCPKEKTNPSGPPTEPTIRTQPSLLRSRVLNLYPQRNQDLI